VGFGSWCTKTSNFNTPDGVWLTLQEIFNDKSSAVVFICILITLTLIVITFYKFDHLKSKVSIKKLSILELIK
jgi:hypothetical protein